MAYLRKVNVTYDSDALDAFGRLPIAQPQTLFDAQFTYDLQPLLYEQITSGAGASIAHDALNRNAQLVLTAAGAGQYSVMQSFEHFRYQPGKGQILFQTFNFGAFVANTYIKAGLYDAYTSVGFNLSRELDGLLYFNIETTTDAGNQSIVQSSWNLDKLNGTGTSGITLDITKTQILVIDFQALYVGRVRFGFDIGGSVFWCHEFLNANILEDPYITTANLPVSMFLGTSGGTATHTAFFQCCSVISSGGQDETVGYEFSTPDSSVTAGNGTRTHLLSLRPKTTFNSITNRVKFAKLELDIVVTGNSPIYWELCIGQAFSVAPTYNDVNTVYSSFEYGTGGTLSGSPSIVIDSGYVSGTTQNKGVTNKNITDRFPITLDYNGAVRNLGTITLLVKGIGATSATRAVLKFKEIR